MRRVGSVVVLSASDIVNFSACAQLTYLDRVNLDTPLERVAEDEQAQLLARKGNEWEATYLEQLRAKHPDLVEIVSKADLDTARDLTLDAIRRGVSVIYQAVLDVPGYLGRADFLERKDGHSRLGDYHYEVVDTKLSRTAKASHALQLCFYSWLLSEIQGVAPRYMHVMLGSGERRSFRFADYARYFQRLRMRAAAAVASTHTTSYPQPCERCATCHWRERCEAQRVADDHLSQVAGITRLQTQRLRDAGIDTFAALAQADPGRHVPSMASDTYRRVQAQAAMQLRGRQTGAACFELKPVMPERGFLRLPPPSEGDVYFDMEGDPLYDGGGLEYLFGVTWREGKELKFRAFWAHNRPEEKLAFEAFIDWISERLRRWPDLHVYHYAAYENSALKRLMSLHGAREPEVDDLLRHQRLVDLYRVAIEALVASTPSYSIKDIETFYRGKRAGEVVTAGGSVVAYENWRLTQAQHVLQEIESYNRDDCESTAQLHEWLIASRPEGATWRETATAAAAPAANPKTAAKAASLSKRNAEEDERNAVKAALLSLLPVNELQWNDAHRLTYLTWCLVDFHKRAEKPTWWKIFSCGDLAVQEMIDDIECIGGLRRIGHSLYAYPDQEFKAREGQRATRVDTLSEVTLGPVDEAQRQIQIVFTKRDTEPEHLSLGPAKPLNSDALRNAVVRFAQSVVKGSDRYTALRAILTKATPRLNNRAEGECLTPVQPPSLSMISSAVAAMTGSYLFIQGPPGAGKTYTGSHVIVDLLQAGRRVGIASNSHKAIINVLQAVEQVADERGFRFRGCKKSTSGNEETEFEGRNIFSDSDSDTALDRSNLLVAGTAWLFARPDADQAFDYLFIDEAGQVALANLVAIGVAAKNIVLLGDQMQLAQPIQGVHPGHSGESVLDYLLDGRATIEPHRGIFLASTWRMHPSVCEFISQAVYDGQLRAAPGRENQRLILRSDAPRPLRPTGVVFLPIDHDACAQKSREEATAVLELYAALLEQRWRDHAGKEQPIKADDILVVAPYNLQVNLLRQTLPAGARVGTVDKFQGQEAAVVLVSMTTSSGEYLPRDIEFLYSKNRINVALSRAKCLAVLAASPRLLDIGCRSPEQIQLVNTLCWVEEYSKIEQ